MGRNRKVIDPRQAERLREALKEAGKSQRALAAFLGIDETAVSKYCRSTNPVPPDRAERIAEFCNVTPGWILCEDGAAKRMPDNKLLPETEAAIDYTWDFDDMIEKLLDIMGLQFTRTGELKTEIRKELIKSEEGSFTDEDGDSALLADRVAFDTENRNAYRVLFHGEEIGSASIRDRERLIDALGSQIEKMAKESLRTFLKAVQFRGNT